VSVTTDHPASLPEGHLAAVRRAIRALDKYRAACTVLETYEQEFRQFRSLQSLNRMTTVEGQARTAWEAVEARTAWEAVEAAMDALRGAVL